MYKDVDAVTDHPAGFWYEEILQAFPDAMVILNVRDSEDVWLKSKVRENDVDMYLNAGFLVRCVVDKELVLPQILCIVRLHERCSS